MGRPSEGTHASLLYERVLYGMILSVWKRMSYFFCFQTFSGFPFSLHKFSSRCFIGSNPYPPKAKRSKGWVNKMNVEME